MKLALGPLAYCWSREEVEAFYVRAEHWPVDIVYLGEVVCAKRRYLNLRDWLAIADRLAAAGKEVVLSSLALVEAESEVSGLERVCGNGRYSVEANDMAAVQLSAGKMPFVAGPHLNCYNPQTLALWAELGARRWVPPVEISGAALAELQATRPEGLETEVLAYGRLPLAYSARCFTARDAGIPKDKCEIRCGDYPDGLQLSTQEGKSLFNVNGVQLQSGLPCNLLGDLDALRDCGVEVLRLMPQMDHMDTVINAFHSALKGDVSAATACESLASLSPMGHCNGYWHGMPGMDWRSQVQVD